MANFKLNGWNSEFQPFNLKFAILYAMIFNRPNQVTHKTMGIPYLIEKLGSLVWSPGIPISILKWRRS